MGTANRKNASSEARNALRADTIEFVRLFKSLVDPYRPEQHYMRGPGPKWHAKHAASSTSDEAPRLPGLARIKS